MIDLHTHTTASDGTLSPRDLVAKAASLNLKALAITDHDTVAGLAEAEEACKEYGVLLIPGIEIEIDHTGGEFHLLGLGLWDWKGSFLNRLNQLVENRKERNEQIFHRMKAQGILSESREIEDLAGGEIVGRSHIAQYLVQRRITKSIEEAFQKYLSPGKPYYVRKTSPSIEQGVDLIHRAGGKAVIAHPCTLYLEKADTLERLLEYKDRGIDGIEAYHPRIPLEEAVSWKTLAENIGLWVSAGSDYHGHTIPDRSLGRSSAGIWIEDQFALPFIPHPCGILTR